jgi:hypothetical protein
MEDTTEQEERKSTWKLKHDTLMIVSKEGNDTALYRIAELTALSMYIDSVLYISRVYESPYGDETDSFYLLGAYGSKNLSREKTFFRLGEHSVLNANHLEGRWLYLGYYTLVNESYEFHFDGTYTREGYEDFSNEKIKRKGEWSLENNIVQLNWVTEKGEQHKKLKIKKVTTSHMVVEGGKTFTRLPN